MKRIVIAIVAIAVVGLATDAMAGALVFRPGALHCMIPTSDWIPGHRPLYGSAQLVATNPTNPGSGNIKYTCHAQLDQGFEPKSAIVDGGVCFAGPNSEYTGSGRITITPSGNINITCQVRPQ
jgi:hypothetical protein